MSERPFFSVIIPTHNRAAILGNAIGSVLDQTYSDYELIIVNDHSDDNTEEIVKGFSDPRIKFLMNSRRRGPSGTRNTGIYAASGQWISFLDDDDIWLTKKLESLHMKIQDLEKNVGIIYTGFAYYDFDRKEMLQIVMPEKQGYIQDELLYKNHIGTLSVVSIKRNALKEAGGIDEKMSVGEDFDLYVRIAGKWKVSLIKNVLTYYRASNADKISLNSKKRLESYREFLLKHNDLIAKSPRLRHRSASLLFKSAFMEKNISQLLRSLPWTLAGICVDLKNFIEILKFSVSRVVRNRAHN